MIQLVLKRETKYMWIKSLIEVYLLRKDVEKESHKEEIRNRV